MEDRKRLYGLDALRACAAFLVCYQHACGTGMVSGYLLAFSGIAVPLFILITGYMYKDVHNRKNEKKQIGKFLRIAVEMELLWFIVDCIYSFLTHKLHLYLLNFISFDNIKRFFLFNDAIAADHGWYMWAILYALVICYILPFLWDNKYCRRCLIVFGWVYLLVFGKYSPLILGQDMPSYLTRSVWGTGMPFLLIGMELRIQHDKGLKLSKRKLYVLLTVGIVLGIIERACLIKYGVNGSRDFYILTLFLAVTVFELFLSMTDITSKNILVTIGVRYSLIVYMVHPAFVRIEKKILPMNTEWQYLGVLFVFGASILVAILWDNVSHWIAKRKKQ